MRGLWQLRGVAVEGLGIGQVWRGVAVEGLGNGQVWRGVAIEGLGNGQICFHTCRMFGFDDMAFFWP
jgi:hypothetical protein